MTVAAIALAVALLVAPAPRRVQLLKARAPKGRRVRWWPVAVMTGLVLGWLLPTTAAAAAAIGAGTAMVRWRRSGARRRRRDEATALQDGLDVVVGELRVGAHPVAALSVAGAETVGAVADSLRTVAIRAQLGADVPGGLRSVAAGSALPSHWERLAVCWDLAESHGLAIATVLRTAQRDIVERERYAARFNAGMAGARTTAAVLAGLPVFGVALGQLIGADPVQFLVSGGVGGALLVAGVTLTCLGLLWSDRITAAVLT